MKIINKNNCEFKLGRIVCEDEVVGMPIRVVMQMRKLELMVQQWEYLRKQKPYSPGPSLEGFKLKLAGDEPIIKAVIPETPTVDQKVKEAMAFMDEVDAVNEAKDFNNTAKEFKELIEWADGEEFIEGEFFGKFDLYTLGNPLELTPAKIADLLTHIVIKED